MAAQRRILIVDDDDSIREIAQVSLELATDWEVLTARTGLEALQRAATDRPDALLLDVMMPGLDGPGTVARMRESDATRHIDVVLLTAKIQPAERERFSALPGVAGVIGKPFDPMRLPAQVAELLSWPTGGL